ncbi:1-acyl-sn-glycerol-3-phosphate acyltransferase [Solirubrobacter pauli]|uniref:1-acyl-sn-glycerol-3-phosphate acyltransferase n=1 Tax=Solirubrobacter pauli TaxID=166793 RepID=A0A660LFJ3_9ACTN|nr:lysophospholipid acyltransferase family protein [Solirubrobacter pauli]RKQ93339.1 1-acyl-sn-glycerol-3-phosphate acyltransferase [Solirubrobacter pauli]
MALTNEEANELSRKRGTSWVYELARIVLTPIAAVWYRLRVTGAEFVPAEGPAIIAPNHKSFYDSFFIGLATKRHLHFMAKTELFEGKKTARLLSGLGAFPVRRGTADPDALRTAQVHLEKGRVLAMFPEGTRHRDPETLREPRRGVGRLAIEAQAPIVPCAITGTDKLFAWGWFPKPVKVQVSFAPAIMPAQLEATPEAAQELIENQVWPEVEREFKRLRANPGLIAAVVAALSAAGGGVAYQQTHKKQPKRKQLTTKAKRAVPRRKGKKKGPFGR